MQKYRKWEEFFATVRSNQQYNYESDVEREKKNYRTDGEEKRRTEDGERKRDEVRLVYRVQ